MGDSEAQTHARDAARPAAGVTHVAVVGLMASGKSTVARALAARIGWPVRDSDADIETRTGQTVREIRDARGEDGLWRVEAAQCLDALGDPGPMILCPAASVVQDDRCLAALAAPGVVVVWLSVDPRVAAARFAAGRHRPWYGDDPAVFIAAQAAVRDPRFAAVADLHLRTDVETPDSAAGRVVALLRDRGVEVGGAGADAPAR